MAISNPSRARILDRIRSARIAPDPAIDGVAIKPEDIFPPMGDPLQRFLVECEANLTQVERTPDERGSQLVFETLLRALPPGSVYAQDAPQLRRFSEAVAGREIIWSSTRRVPEDVQASITLCEGLIAQTGSILSSSRGGGRGASIVPPTHIVYATSDQIIPDISSALRMAMNGDLVNASYFGLISGSSRTADIEKILVQGAHGPVKVIVVLEERNI